MATKRTDDYERAAAGMDFEDPIRERAAAIGASIAENGPEALFDELENLLPESWREHIQTFPIAAVLVGFGVGVFLGMKKSEEIIAAGTTLVTSVAMANLSGVASRFGGGR